MGTLDIKEALTRLADENNMSLEEIRQELDNSILAERNKECVKTAEGNKDLEGRCFKVAHKPHSGLFPEMCRYYKVISCRSENEYRVECLVFDEHPTYWFEYKACRTLRTGDWYLGSFDFDSFRTEDIMARSIREGMEPISEEEFNDAARKYVEELLITKWTPDHFRFGGKLPTDKNWEDPNPKRPYPLAGNG